VSVVLSLLYCTSSEFFVDRMPPQIGDFISQQIYFNQLKSNNLHPISSATTACHFIDVADGAEQHKENTNTFMVIINPDLY